MLFGGFTHCSFELGLNFKNSKDDKLGSFIFSLTKKTRHFNHTKKTSIWINRVKAKGGFGFGEKDLKISDDCQRFKWSSSNLGYDYELPVGLIKDSNEAKSYLAGEPKFKVLEIEMYSVKFK